MSIFLPFKILRDGPGHYTGTMKDPVRIQVKRESLKP